MLIFAVYIFSKRSQRKADPWKKLKHENFKIPYLRKLLHLNISHYIMVYMYIVVP